MDQRKHTSVAKDPEMLPRNETSIKGAYLFHFFILSENETCLTPYAGGNCNHQTLSTYNYTF